MLKFILLGQGRSGSTLIVRSLQRHPNVLMGSEHFHAEQEERHRYYHELNGGYPPERPPQRYYRDGEDGYEYLRDHVFHEREAEDQRAVGFKMFYQHARENARIKRAWDYLTEHRDVHVVHLSRRNLFESFVSLKVAFITREWNRQRGAAPKAEPPPPFELDVRECESYCTRATAFKRWADERFAAHPRIEVEYERDVCGRFASMMDDVYGFLGLPSSPAEPLLVKLARRHPREQVSNYEELKEYFRHTLYEGMFE
jgi:LPS sulfotransferase NodH